MEAYVGIRLPDIWRDDLIVIAEELGYPSLAYLVRNVLLDFRNSCFRSDSRKKKLEAIRNRLQREGKL